MWSALPKNLRYVLGLALLLSAGVAAAAFRLSFIALREVGSNPELKFGKGNAWLLPVIIDLALVGSEVILLGASMVRVRNKRGELETYDRTIPFLLVAIFGAMTIYFNVTRVPVGVRAVTVIPPVASILMTLALAYLMKMLATVSGADVIHEAPPPLAPRRIVRGGDTIHGEIIRPSAPAGDTAGDVARIETPSGPGSENGQTGRDGVSDLAVYGAKRLQVEAHLEDLGPAAEQMPARTLTRTLNERGVNVSERYVKDILDQRRGARRR